MNIEFLENRQWSKLLESLDEGPNIIMFKSVEDMNSCRSVASYLNMKSKTTRISCSLHKPQLIGNFFKGPKGAPKGGMTKRDAFLLESARYLPAAAFTDSFLSGFETEDGRRRARLMLTRKQGEEKMQEMIANGIKGMR